MVFQEWANGQASATASQSDELEQQTPRAHDIPGQNLPPAYESEVTAQHTDTPPYVPQPSDLAEDVTIPERPKLVRASSSSDEAPDMFLLVDDNKINMKILSAYMKKLRVRRYQTADNGQEAVDIFQRDPSRCRVILMDVSMPVMDGFEATRQIRICEKKHGLEPATIIALTGLASEESQQEAFGSGMDLFLTKPVKLQELGAILRTVPGLLPTRPSLK